MSHVKFLDFDLDEIQLGCGDTLDPLRRGLVRRSSGVTSKPAIEGHFKTGQRTSTLDYLIFSTGRRSGNSILSETYAGSAGHYSSPPAPASGGEI
jgi:hypothetical protein